MSTWLSKMNNGGMSGGMKREPIVPGLNTSAAKVSKTKAAVDAAKIASEGEKSVKEAETNENNDLGNVITGDQIAKEGQDDLDKADAAEVADTSYITKSEPKKKATIKNNMKPKPSGGKIAPVIIAAAINAISKKKK